MVFSSITFLFLFLPLVLAIYYLLFTPVIFGVAPNFWRRASNLFLLVVSLVFYFWGEKFLVWIVITSTTIDYICGLIISEGFLQQPKQLIFDDGRTFRHKFGLIASICSNLAFLGVFKYFNFGIDSFNNFMQTLSLTDLQLNNIARITLPLGISFYTFQSMSYTIDVYRGNIRATRNFIDFACYVTMFPQLVAGPIVRYRDISEQLTHRTINTNLFASGVTRFIIGLGKKILIANNVAVTADNIFSLPDESITTKVAWLGIFAYTLQIYFDFSGYSDMAIGLGRMFGFRFKENFDYPYIASSVREFWRRWHISLSSWFKDYLYIPLGGSRHGANRTYFNLVIVFFLCGLWHGASWTFVIWGLYHGFFLVLERLWLGRQLDRLGKFPGHIYTLLVVICGWVIFRCDTIFQAFVFLSAMFGLAPVTHVASDEILYLSRDIRLFLFFGAIFSMPVLPVVKNWLKSLRFKSNLFTPVIDISTSIFSILVLLLIMILCSMSLAAGTHNPFIYFRF